MFKIVSHIVAAKWEHCKRIMTKLANLTTAAAGNLGYIELGKSLL